MNWFEALLLGIIQGLTEFLPISSSAHLIIFQQLSGIEISGNQLEFEVLLHLASLLAVTIFFRKEVSDVIYGFFAYSLRRQKQYYSSYRFGLLIISATAITATLGKVFEQVLSDRLTNPATIGASLIVTGIFLVFIEHGVKPGTRQEANMTWKDGVIVGFGQALAVIPGISRAGSTLVTSLWCGLDKKTAVRYSFLLSIPLILGISVTEIPNLSPIYFHTYLKETIIAFLASFIFAIIGIKWLITMVNNTKLSYFSIYCFIVGASVWLWMSELT